MYNVHTYVRFAINIIVIAKCCKCLIARDSEAAASTACVQPPQPRGRVLPGIQQVAGV